MSGGGEFAFMPDVGSARHEARIRGHPGTSRASSRAGAVDYATQIKPLLKQKCYACHGGLKQKAGLRLDTVQLLLKGGKSGSAAKLILERVTREG